MATSTAELTYPIQFVFLARFARPPLKMRLASLGAAPNSCLPPPGLDHPQRRHRERALHSCEGDCSSLHRRPQGGEGQGGETGGQRGERQGERKRTRRQRQRRRRREQRRRKEGQARVDRRGSYIPASRAVLRGGEPPHGNEAHHICSSTHNLRGERAGAGGV